MDKNYDPGSFADDLYRSWEERGFFKPQASPPKGKKPFCIALPPPNVTGTLHMGHGFQVSLMDALIRYHRMLGEDVLWQGGIDHAGIATQMVVERQLEATSESRKALGREEFVRRIWQWKARSGQTITRQLRRLGASIDWDKERFTMDEEFSEAVLGVFVRLYEEGLIYRDKRLVNWDPVLLTALSDLEVQAEEEAGILYHVRYPLVDDENEAVVIATTRPETILVDGAIAVHPEDKRFRSLLGKKVWVPMTEPARAIEIIADEHVDATFGTGCVKITPAHDFNDYEVFQRHPEKRIPLLVLMTGDARLNENAPEKYRGMDRHAARKAIVKDLAKAGLLVKEEAHRYKLPRGDRSGAVLEPMLTEQWFMDMNQLAKKALAAVADGRTRFVPEQWRNTFNVWLNDIQDWCISRQLWWGHRIPAWYDEQGRCWVATSEKEAIQKAEKAGAKGPLRRDDSVLDTWFSSALWSFVPLGWPQSTEGTKRWHPTSVLVTGFDIIFFWVARMMMMSLHLMEEVPFSEVFVHGLVLDRKGQKMSKSKGNILDPIDLIDGIEPDALVAKRTEGLMQPKMRENIAQQTRKEFPKGLPAYGADALRFTFCALATTGRNVHFDTRQIEGYRNFCTKLWNAARFVGRQLDLAPGGKASILTSLRNYPVSDATDLRVGLNALLHVETRWSAEKNAEHMDKDTPVDLCALWIMSRLHKTIKAVREGLDSYRLDLAAKALYDFVWHEYCDWYLECAKITLQQEKTGDQSLDEDIDTQKHIVLAVATHVLEQTLRLAHPFMPFISEELWLKFPCRARRDAPESLMLCSFPEVDADWENPEAEAAFDFLARLIKEVRTLRAELGISPATRLSAHITQLNQREASRLRAYRELFFGLTNTELMVAEYSAEADYWKTEEGRQYTSILVDGLDLRVRIGHLIDMDEERKRLARQIERLDHKWQKTRTRLDNAEFVKNAPEDLVAATEQQHQSLARKRDHLQRQLQFLEATAT